MRAVATLVAVAAGVTVVTSASVEVVLAAPTFVPSSAETVPVQTSGDSMDDPAIWVHPTDPSLSLVLGNNKLGTLETYNLDGSLHQRLSDEVSFWGNVDVRQNVSIAGRTRDLVAVTHRGIQFYEVSPTTRMLEPITDGIAVGSNGEGLCMYKSGTSGTLYVVNITLPGRLRQYEVRDADADGLVDVQVVRDFAVGSEAEGCVADDATGALLVSEEDVALWKYDAEPTGGTARTAIDRPIAAGGELAPDIEGFTLVTIPGGAGYYIVSAQNVADPNNSFFAVYERQAPHAFVTTFRVGNGTTSDDCDRTDGVAAVAGDLGPNFPAGLFVCQDNNNDRARWRRQPGPQARSAGPDRRREPRRQRTTIRGRDRIVPRSAMHVRRVGVGRPRTVRSSGTPGSSATRHSQGKAWRPLTPMTKPAPTR